MLEYIPRFDLAAAERLARDHFGLDGRAAALPSERDQNFLISGPRGDRLVLKVANAAEERPMIEAQQRALTHLASRLDVTPRVMSTVTGQAIAGVPRADDAEHLVWAVSWLDGTPMGALAYRSPALHEHLGRQVGALQRGLEDFDHPAARRDFYWDLANARTLVETKRSLVTDATLGAAIDRIVRHADRYTVPRLDRLRCAVVHGDLNDYNILVAESADGDNGRQRGQRITGIIDFGDMVHSYRVAELAVAVAYAMLGHRDPLGVAAAMVRGYCAENTLDDDELGTLFGLALLRLCASVCIAAEQQARRPDNAYLGVSQRAIRDALPALAAIPFGLAEATLRAAAGVEASPPAARVRAYLERAVVSPVLGIDLAREPVCVVDLSISSPLLSGDASDNVEALLSERIFGAMVRAGARVGVGGYGEARLLYVVPAFAIGPRPTDPHRTIHIGLDLFAPAGTPVFAPIAGTVHAVADNARPQDYGPVVILRHTTDDGTEFFTLYGHLARASVVGLETGRAVAAGDQIAALGEPTENGGWTPHLHLQVITDLLDLGTDFPGVALPSGRDAWLALCPDPNLLARVPVACLAPAPPTAEQTRSARTAHFGRNVSLSYHDPLKIVRGWKQYLYDETGRCYLDAFNNVPHVGHSHLRVVEAGAAQMRVLNTNTRYLHDAPNRYAERLLATLPPELSVCYFVNSASEANELALRLARAYTGGRDTIVLGAAYHGNTTSLVDISPYKHAGPGGAGAPDWVHVAPVPDDYRGPYRRDDPRAGERYADAVGAIVTRLRGERRRLAAFIAETCPSVGGQLLLPPGYLEQAYAHVRRGGGVCIADEVQTGLGRMGTSFWAFEDHHVVPDIVVMGKPLGNGHPIGAVATTRSIADAFDNGMEYFSTFGGNTVSCAIGLAVLDVLRDERLQEHARRVGDHLLGGLRALLDRHALVGDVRGSGLFIGVELVRDRETLEPARAEADEVVNRMCERGVLIGSDGPYHNVLKIRPPMSFDAANADQVVETLDAVLGELAPARAHPA